MSDDLGQVREHLVRNDHRLDALEAKMESEASLRAMMDQDQATLKTQLAAQGKLMQAVATTQGEHSRLLTRLEDKVVGLDRKVSRLETDVAETKVGVQLLVGMFTKRSRKNRLGLSPYRVYDLWYERRGDGSGRSRGPVRGGAAASG